LVTVGLRRLLRSSPNVWCWVLMGGTFDNRVMCVGVCRSTPNLFWGLVGTGGCLRGWSVGCTLLGFEGPGLTGPRVWGWCGVVLSVQGLRTCCRGCWDWLYVEHYTVD